MNTKIGTVEVRLGKPCDPLTGEREPAITTLADLAAALEHLVGEYRRLLGDCSRGSEDARELAAQRIGDLAGRIVGVERSRHGA